MSPEKPEYIDKELSWLSFNERVLQEAANSDTPLIQRVRYLGIFSNNMDEFFRVRVADVSRLASFTREQEIKARYQALLSNIQEKALFLQDVYEETYGQVLKDLRRRHIYLIDESQLDEAQSKKVNTIFDHTIAPQLNPILIDKGADFPAIEDGAINLAVKLIVSEKDKGQKILYALVNIPTHRLPRFIQIPNKKGLRGKTFIVLENIIRHNLSKVFRGVIPIESAEAYQFKITRDAELEMGEGIDQSFIDRISRSIKKRHSADPERFVFDENMPQDLVDLLRKALNLDAYDSVMPGGRYHNAKDFMDFPSVGPSYLQFKPLSVLPVPELASYYQDFFSESIFSVIRKQDILLYYPYNSFDIVIDLLQTAAIDPAVDTISICLYRAASNSKIVNALTSAVKNKKRVNAVVELQARFDEEANIGWARELTEAGVNVTFGVPGLKVHGKLILIERTKNSKTRYYSHVGTGNFNEKTAAVYTDFSLITYDQAIGRDVKKVFDFISYTYRHYDYEKLLVSPHSNRQGLLKLIQRETDNAAKGEEAQIDIKCNNLVDPEIIDALYLASQSGVYIRIICRGMFSLVPGIKGLSDNIEAISIIDRFLEHPRVYSFHNRGERESYISSADLMTRNLDFRVEVSAPVNDPQLKQRMQDIFDIQWCDNIKARDLSNQKKNKIRKQIRGQNIRSQEAIHSYLKSENLPTAVKRARKRWEKELRKRRGKKRH